METWDRGVQVSWLLQFTEEKACWDYPTWKVVQDIIRPETEARKCRYSDLPGMVVSGSVGKRYIFVSHAWGSLWGDLVSASLDGVPLESFVWIDVFAIMQWDDSLQRHLQERDLRQLTAVVAMSDALLCVVGCDTESERQLISAGKKLLALPSEILRRVPFQRIWCLEEIHTALQCGKTVVCTLGNRTGDAREFRPCDVELIPALYFGLDVAEAQATVARDRVAILRKVQARDGVAVVNARLRGALIGALATRYHPEVRRIALSGATSQLGEVRDQLDECRGPYAVTPLAAAAALGDTRLVHSLLVAGSPLRGALFWAAEAGHAGVVRALLAARADVSETISCDGEQGDKYNLVGMSALMAAANGNHFEAVQVLLQAGAPINAEHPKIPGLTALKSCAKNGAKEAARALLDAGAEECTEATELLLQQQKDHKKSEAGSEHDATTSSQGTLAQEGQEPPAKAQKTGSLNK